MARIKGSPKTGGRKKGTPNKSRVIIADKLEQYNFCVVQNIIELFSDSQTPPDIKCRLLSMLLEYTTAKPAPILEPEEESFSEAESQEAETVLANGH